MENGDVLPLCGSEKQVAVARNGNLPIILPYRGATRITPAPSFWPFVCGMTAVSSTAPRVFHIESAPGAVAMIRNDRSRSQ
jgi:hypothetical protein